MKRIFAFAFASAVAIGSAHGGTSMTVDVQPGPYGGYRVHTSWGDYMVVQNGSTIWVGTEAEFDRSRAAAIAERDGFKEFKPAGIDTGTAFFVSKGLPSAVVGTNQIAGISTAILFGVGADKKLKRPPKPQDTEYVSINWIQSKNQKTIARILDTENNRTYLAYNCSVISGEHICEFVVPRNALATKSALIFASQGNKPAFVPLSSLSMAHYNTLLDAFRPSGNTAIEPNAEQIDDVKRLHEINEAIPEKFPRIEGVTYLPSSAPLKECTADQPPITRTQFESIHVGDKYENLECKFGVPIGTTTYVESPVIERTWRFSGMKKVIVGFDPKTNQVIDKQIMK